MDYKIYNIELVNRLLAWQHTAFNLFPVSSSPILDRVREATSILPLVRPEFIEPLNVISLKAADFVLHHKICRFFIVPFPRCWSSPCRLNFLKNSDEKEEQLMWQRNNGQGEANILQNQFTAYLVAAIHWQKIAYLRKRTKLGKHELPTSFDSPFTHTLEFRAENVFSVEQPILDSITVAHPQQNQ